MNNANFNNALTGGLLLFLLLTLHLPFPHPPGSGLFLPSNIVAWATMAYSCLVVCLANMLPGQQKPELSLSPLTRRLALVTLMLGIPLLYSPEMWWMDGAAQWMGAAGGFAFYFCLVQTRLTIFHHRMLLSGVAVAALIQSVVGALYLLVWLPEKGEWYASGLKIGGVLLQHNVTATFLMVGLGAALLLLLEPVYRAGKLMRGLLMFTLAALSFMLVHLQSRIGLLNGLVILVFFGILYGRREPERCVIALWCVLTGIALAFALIIFAPAGHLDLVHEASNRYRIQMLRETWKMIELHPLSGWGLGSFGYHYSQFLVISGIASQESVVVQHPHNEWLFGWAEGGLVTVLAYVVLLVSGWQLWRQTCRRDNEQRTTFRRGLWILLLPMLLHTQVEYPFYLSVVLWLLFLLLLAMLDGVSYGATGTSPGVEHKKDDRILISSALMRAGSLITGFISLLALLYMLTGLQSGLVLSGLELAQVKNPPERAMHADLDAIHRTLWNPWIFEERFEFDRQLENLLRFNITRDPRLLLGYLSWSSRYLASRFNPDVFAARMMILDAAGRHSQAQRIRMQAHLLYPRDNRFISLGGTPPATGRSYVMSELMERPALTRWRLQPIVSAYSGRTMGCEVLTRFPSTEQAERYFQFAPPATVMALFTEQCEWIRERGASALRYFCNLPVSVLSQASFRLDLTTSEAKGAFPVVELQDPQSIALLSDKDLRQLMRNLAQLQRHSVSLWLDDVTPALLPVVRAMVRYFDGIKIDKGAFWRLAAEPSLLKDLVAQCHQLSPLVLIEGIETVEHRQLATEAGADYLQGFLWADLLPAKPGVRRA